MALKIVKGTLERVLDKNLQDLVRGIRNHKDNEVKVTTCIIITKSYIVNISISVKLKIEPVYYFSLCFNC